MATPFMEYNINTELDGDGDVDHVCTQKLRDKTCQNAEKREKRNRATCQRERSGTRAAILSLFTLKYFLF